MNTVFQLGTAVITKDLVFGWVVGRDDRFFAVSSMDEISLHELTTAVFPAYLDEFKEACAAQLELLLKAKEERSRTEKELLLKAEEEKQKRRQQMQDELQERLDVIKMLSMQIIDGLVNANGVAELKGRDGHVYATVMKHSSFTEAYKVSGEHTEFAATSIHDAAAFIARRWW